MSLGVRTVNNESSLIKFQKYMILIIKNTINKNSTAYNLQLSVYHRHNDD